MKRREGTVLVIDDEEDMAESVGVVLRAAGHRAVVETDPRHAAAQVDSERPDVVVTDLRMPGVTGLQLLDELQAAHPETPVIVITGYASIDSAVEAMRRGAADYIAKPFSNDELLLRIDKALEWAHITAENRLLREQAGAAPDGDQIIGESKAIADILSLVNKVAVTDARVLLTGESGTGKELIARTLHRRSQRAQAPFFAVNCGALHEGLLESELFGHERGAFTGAVGVKKGIFEVADGGTLFLDEISETSLPFQTKLLRVLEESEFLRVGGTATHSVDVRIIASSNRDPRQCVAEGRLREDLYYRLSVVRIHLPPLRERGEDVQPLADHFLRVYSAHIKKRVRGIHPDALAALRAYAWPGNIRELVNVIERGVIMAEDGADLMLDDLPSDMIAPQADPVSPREEVRDAERALIVRMLRECNGNRSRAAQRLGIGRRTLYDKMARLGISQAGDR